MELQKNKKISEMVSDFAGDFISLGEDIQEMQQYLHAAVSAWNIACLDKRDRVRLIKSHMKNYQKMNLGQEKKTYNHFTDLVIFGSKTAIFLDSRLFQR